MPLGVRVAPVEADMEALAPEMVDRLDRRDAQELRDSHRSGPA